MQHYIQSSLNQSNQDVQIQDGETACYSDRAIKGLAFVLVQRESLRYVYYLPIVESHTRGESDSSIFHLNEAIASEK